MSPLIHIIKLTAAFFAVLGLACFGLSPTVQAVTPPPDGGYPGSNTAEGQSALFSLTTGIHNTALGFQALFRNTTGNVNTASGSEALLNNTTGYRNTAEGFSALFSNTTGFENTAIGLQALYGNTTGNTNTATGVQAMYSNTSGSENTASGYLALFGNGAGLYNTATGARALYSNLTGNNNTAVGDNALVSNFLGNNNIALGYGAGGLITDGEFNIDIGNNGVFDESNTIRIGDPAFQTAAFIAGISGVNEGGTISAVYINTDGQLGTQPPASSRRYKKEIKPMDKVSEAILALNPVTFQYKSDNKGVPQFGLIAEEVAKVNPGLVLPDQEGKPYTVRYDAVNAMLLNEFLKEHRKVEQLEKQVEALTAGLQRVSAQLEVSKPAPQTVLNDQ
jgi:hypothetical protein